MPPRKRNRSGKVEGTVYYLNPVEVQNPPPASGLDQPMRHYVFNPPPPKQKQTQIQPQQQKIAAQTLPSSDVSYPLNNRRYSSLRQEGGNFPSMVGGPVQINEYNNQPILQTGITSILQAAVTLNDNDVEFTNAVLALNGMKERNHTSFPPAASSRFGSVHDSTGGSIKPQRILINRNMPERYQNIAKTESSIRDPESGHCIREDTSGAEPVLLPELEPFNVKYSDDIITFSNGNNRERRRAELFGYYSETYRYKEKNRDSLYLHQKKQYEDRLNKLYLPRDPNTGLSTSMDVDDELFNIEQDIAEKRDLELSRLRAWRRVKRNENLKTYYDESLKIYKDAHDLVNNKLEKLKFFFLRQKSLLSTLERDFSEIGSARAEKFYAGFNGLNSINTVDQSQPNNEGEGGYASSPRANGSNVSDLENSSETDTGASSAGTINHGSSRRAKVSGRNSRIAKRISSSGIPHGNQVLSSILEGFAPLLTEREFSIVTGDDLSSRYVSIGALSTEKNESDTDGSTTTGLNDGSMNATTTKKRSVGRPSKSINPETNSAKEHNASLNKIMKHYLSPDDLKAEEVEKDLELLRKAKHP